MGKKTRKKVNKTRYISTEGYSEIYFIEFLKELYKCDENNIKITMPQTPPGGNPDVIIAGALKNNHYDYSLAFLDEDKEINVKLNYKTHLHLKRSWLLSDLDETIPLNELQKHNIKRRKPILIVSQPAMFEGFIIRIMGRKLPDLRKPYTDKDCAQYNKQVLKTAFCGLIQGSKGRDNEINFYRNNLTIDYLEQKALDIPELSLLLPMFR